MNMICKRRHALALLAAAPALAQASVGGNISLLVPYPAGGQADAVARFVQNEFERVVNKTVVVENAPGGSGAIAVNRVLNTAPDGRVLLVGTPLELIQAPLGLAAVKHRPEQLRMLSLMGRTALMLVVRPNLPVANVAELLALVRKSRPEMSYCSSGRGSIFHLVSERFGIDAGIKLLQVPYRGGAQMLPALAAGEVDMGFIPLGGPVMGMIRQGRLKALAITTAERHKAFPDVPTMDETGLFKGFEFDAWAALVAARGIPEEAAQQLNAAMGQVIRQPKVRADIEGSGMAVAAAMGLAETERFYASEAERYQRIAQAIGLRPE